MRHLSSWDLLILPLLFIFTSVLLTIRRRHWEWKAGKLWLERQRQITDERAAKAMAISFKGHRDIGGMSDPRD